MGLHRFTMSLNEASWILEPKGDLQVLPAPYPVPVGNEIVIKVCTDGSCSLVISRALLDGGRLC